MEISSILVAFLENANLNLKSGSDQHSLLKASKHQNVISHLFSKTHFCIFTKVFKNLLYSAFLSDFLLTLCIIWYKLQEGSHQAMVLHKNVPFLKSNPTTLALYAALMVVMSSHDSEHSIYFKTVSFQHLLSALLNWFKLVQGGRLGTETCTVHLISDPDQPGRK